MYDEHYNRSGLDRRSEFDRRYKFSNLSGKTKNQRVGLERRNQEERRFGWVNVSPWHSVCLGVHVAELVLYS
jgi:hypothetical protein